MSYYVIGDEDTVLGFSLVGIPGNVVDSADQAREAFVAAVKDQVATIVVLTEKVGEMIRPQVQQQVFRMAFPLVVEIPDRNGPLPGKKPISQMITEAIGVKI